MGNGKMSLRYGMEMDARLTAQAVDAVALRLKTLEPSTA
jgi:hypothetical protein